ncbi:acyl-CoA mutase large subunit family protein [uncultured Dialister sp.]|uniref:acyl-CoA mutase large subunit family protein n=1 Tax=Dialister succinatiphilus TaxID=487173 RepID=UPI0026DD2093|nr:methylmalonyl-CoA mutase family protein [uncultured Dialister sp.]
MSNESLKAKLDAYNAEYAKQVAKHPERVGLKHKNLYTPLDLDGFDYEKDLGFPGEYPYTRGVQPTMYRGRLWTMRMYAGFSTAEESNKRYKYLIANGGTGLSVAFDLPTQIGYDSDDKMSAGEVGKVGVAIDSLYDMERLFDGIDLGKVSTSMTINAPASVLLAMYIAVAEKQGVPASALRGTIQNDILKEYAARGTYIFPVKPSMRLITDIFEYCSANVPKWNTISISGYHIREAGSTAAQEVAFTIADGIAYIEAALKAGMKIDEFAPRLSFFWNAHNNVLEEVAKFRASRRIWARVLKERFHAENPKSMKLRFHTQTAGSMLTAQQPNNNIIRVALQTAAAVMGGTQSLHTNSRDEALALPTTESVTIALRTQQIVAYESGLADVVDPLGGSYYVEAMTNAIEEEVMQYIKKIDEMGGAVEAIDKGYIQKEIQDSAYAWQMAVESGEKTIVGVNKFTMEEPPVTGLLKIDASVGERKKAQLAKDKENRDQAKVAEELAKLEKAAQTPAEGPDHVNLMPVILDCVRAYCTEGEICGVLRKVFGEYKPHNTL